MFGPERRRCARAVAVELGAAVPARAGQLTLHAGAEHADAAAEAAHRAGAVQRGGAVAAVVAPIDGRRAGCSTRRQCGASGGTAAVAGEVRDAGGALREFATRQRRLQQRVDGGVTQQARRVMLQGGG